MAVESGVPKQEGGVWVGATDFSEFALSTSGSTAFTFLGETADDPGHGIGNDAEEGNYFYATPANFDSVAWKYDVFDDLTAYGELLCRFYGPDPVGNRRTIGPVIQASGDGTAGGRNWMQGGIYYRSAGSDHESVVIRDLNGAGGIALGIDMQDPEESDAAWYWCRMRVLFSTSGSTADGDHYSIKIWSGSSTEEPSTWDGDQAGVKSIRSTAGIGWGMEALVRQAQMRVAFLSFSEDPDAAAAPAPGDISGAVATAEYLAKLDWRS